MRAFARDMAHLNTLAGIGSAAQTGQAVTATATTARAVASGGADIGADIGAILSVASLLSSIGSSPGKERYNNVYKPNAQKVISATGYDFVTGCAAVGWDANTVAAALSQYLTSTGTPLTASQLLADASPSVASNASGVGASITQAIQSFTNGVGGSMAPLVFAGGGALLLLLLLRK